MSQQQIEQPDISRPLFAAQVTNPNPHTLRPRPVKISYRTAFGDLAPAISLKDRTIPKKRKFKKVIDVTVNGKLTFIQEGKRLTQGDVSSIIFVIFKFYLTRNAVV